MNSEHDQWLDVADKLPTYEEVKEHLNPALRSMASELINEWENK